MRLWKCVACCTLFSFPSALIHGNARAANADVLAEITDTADRICGFVEQSGSSTSVEVKGDVKAELNGLFLVQKYMLYKMGMNFLIR
jgi:hypothetical protein